MECPFCKSQVNQGATVCASCGATEKPYGGHGRYDVNALAFASIALMIIASLFALVMTDGARTNFGFFIFPIASAGMFAYALILRRRPPMWVRRS